jgi:hypothetical protein
MTGAVGQKGGSNILDVPLGLGDHPFKIAVFLDELDVASDRG